jgi:hypothetical protein
MREYGKVYCALWSSTDFRSLDEDARMLVLYLLTSPHATIAGVFRLPDGYITEDVQWPRERVAEGFQNLEDNGFATRCPVTQWVWICKFLTWNPPENPNQWKAVEKIVATIPKDCLWLGEFLASSNVPNAGEKRNGSETVPEPVTVTGTVVVTGTGVPTAAAPPRRRPKTDDGWFSEFRRVYPKRSGDQGWTKALRAANARIAEGHTPDEMINGATRYLGYCQATERVGSEFVKQAATFLGPDKHFLERWTPPPSKTQVRQDANVAASLEWLEKTDAPN